MPKHYRLTTRPGSGRRFAGAAMTGADLRKIRVNAGISQAELADEAGYNPTYLGMLETGRHRITERAARLLMAAIERATRISGRTSQGTAAR